VTARPADLTAVTAGDRVDANGTMWRMRALTAMGHDATRIAGALHARPELVRRLLNGREPAVPAEFCDQVAALLDAWWDKTPPRDTTAQRRTAARTLRLAERRGWPAAAGQDDDQPGYRPWSAYRPATGTGTAPDYPPPRTRPLHRKDIA
jgi:hypothetical protein